MPPVALSHPETSDSPAPEDATAEAIRTVLRMPGSLCGLSYAAVDKLFGFWLDALGPVETEDKARGFPSKDEPGVILIPVGKGRYAKVDAEDYVLVKSQTWHAHARGYARAREAIGGVTCASSMHRVVLLLGEGDSVVDHINHDPLDNRKVNLRRCTSRSENSWNARRQTRNTSGHKGVCRHDAGWQATVVARGVRHQKWFQDLDEAAAWVRDARSRLHGEFACHE